MAIDIHYVNVAFRRVNSVTGQVVSADDPATTIGAMLRTHSEHRVTPDVNVPNSAGYPTVKQYLEAEAADGFKLQYMDQTQIITYGV